MLKSVSQQRDQKTSKSNLHSFITNNQTSQHINVINEYGESYPQTITQDDGNFYSISISPKQQSTQVIQAEVLSDKYQLTNEDHTEGGVSAVYQNTFEDDTSQRQSTGKVVAHLRSNLGTAMFNPDRLSSKYSKNSRQSSDSGRPSVNLKYKRQPLHFPSVSDPAGQR